MSVADIHTLDGIPGVVESRISRELADRLPEAPAAPWRTSGSGIAWLHRAVPKAARHHQHGLDYRWSVPLTLGAFLRYEEGPVGAYDEVLAAPSFLLRQGHVAMGIPFIAVDSQASIRGGRENWALPKTLAEFRWQTRNGRPHELSADGDGWSVSVRVRWSAPRVLLFARARQAQVRADGAVLTVPIQSRGVGRCARVEVACSGPTLPQWLRPGVHFGVLIERATHVIERPELSSRGRGRALRGRGAQGR